MEKSKIVVVDDKLVHGLLMDPRFLHMFPVIDAALKAGRFKIEASVKAGSCKPCQVKAKQFTVDAMSAKLALSQLSADDKEKLKSFLNTNQVKIVFKTKQGKIVQIDF